MKKFLLSCFVALGIGATAQITVNEEFESSPVQNFSISGGYQPNRYTDGGCNGDNGGYGSNIYAGTSSSQTVNIIYTKPASVTANGKKIDITFNYTTFPYQTGTIGGTITVSYIKANTGTSFTTIQTVAIPTTPTNCGTVTASIPESANVNGEFRLRIQAATTSTPSTRDFYFFVDNVKITQEATDPPVCSTTTVPANGVNPYNLNKVNWTTAAGASTYKLKVGTTSGAGDIVDVTGLTTNSYTLPNLSANTTYFVNVTPSNAFGDAASCTESSFTTGASGYCDAGITATTPDELISRVVLAGAIDNPSTGGSGYQNHTAVIGNVIKGQQYLLTVTSAPVYSVDGVIAWIDYNQDQIFSDDEKTVLAFSSGTSTANITIDNPNLVFGNTRMRIRLHYNEPNITACGNSAYGEVEDYTLNIQDETMSVSDIKKNSISVYPNPFTDVLKISDVKGVKSVSVNDVSGREVKSLAPSAELNLSNLKAGLYIVNLKMEDGSVKTFKAIKK